jgi:acyl-CoA hydrolase
MVSLDRHGRPAPVPALEPETPDEMRRQREAQVRRDNRLAEREAISASRVDGSS